MTTSTNFHAGSRSSQEYLYDLDIPTPSDAERAKTMACQIATGTLSTIANASVEQAGYPYGSLVSTALHRGNPVFLISGLAEHTQNLRGDARASLLLTEQGEDNPLALGRLTLLGDCTELSGDRVEPARNDYLEQHPEAQYYLEYGDFSFWQLEVRSLRWIGGFGRMSWIRVEDWLGATPDPLAAEADAIIAHMNADHRDALSAYCKAFTKAQEFSDVQMTGVDRYGFEMSVETPAGSRPLRLAFERSLTNSQQVREAFVALVKEARAKLGESIE